MRTATFPVLVLLSLFAVAIVGTPALAVAQEAQQAPQEQSASGELASVDAEKSMLTIALADDTQQTFQYTAETKVSGAQGGTEGLASMSGRQVTITYRMEGSNRVATMIQVAPER